MSTIKHFSNGQTIDFGKGRFDDWCVSTFKDNKICYPKDTECFRILQRIAQIHGGLHTYNDFILIYNGTTNIVEKKELDLIEFLSKQYVEQELEIEILFTILYATMIAEENKANTRLGKRIKRLGVHQILIDCFDPLIAADFSKGKPWYVLDEECKRRGF